MKKQGIILVYGNFKNLHTGHFRLLKFASGLGTKLKVGVHVDSLSTLESELKFDIFSQLNFINEVILYTNVEQLIRSVKPDLVVKGREFEGQDNKEIEVINEIGAKLIFSSGDFYLNEADFTRKENSNHVEINRKFQDYLAMRKDFNRDSILDLVQGFKNLKVCVVGDVIVDKYVNCRAVGLSQEDSSVVYTPIEEINYLGGAGIVAAHCSKLGAQTTFVSITGSDESSHWAEMQLTESGVSSKFISDDSRPTTIKLRYRMDGRVLFRLTHYQNSPIQQETRIRVSNLLSEMIDEFDLLIFSDFSYGVLDQQLATELLKKAKENSVFTSADSQSSSQIGSLSKFQGCDLVTPTEKEARLELRNELDGLSVVASRLRERIAARHIMLKLGPDGVLIDGDENDLNPSLIQKIPAFNPQPIDVSGAGDSLLAASSMCLAQQSKPLEAAVVGSLVAALQVSREGNRPISAQELLQLIEM